VSLVINELDCVVINELDCEEEEIPAEDIVERVQK